MDVQNTPMHPSINSQQLQPPAKADQVMLLWIQKIAGRFAGRCDNDLQSTCATAFHAGAVSAGCDDKFDTAFKFTSIDTVLQIQDRSATTTDAAGNAKRRGNRESSGVRVDGLDQAMGLPSALTLTMVSDPCVTNSVLRSL